MPFNLPPCLAQTPDETISAAGFRVYLHGFSAIDSYLDRSGAAVHALCGAGLADLARLFEGLRYPGAALADAAVDSGGKTWYFRCDESGVAHSFGFLEFYQDCKTGRFYDPNGIYPQLRRIRKGQGSLPGSPSCGGGGFVQGNVNDPYHVFDHVFGNAFFGSALFDGAMLLAKYFPETASREINAIAENFRGRHGPPPGIEEQRLLLTGLLEAANPAPGFELLIKSGFIASCWPELAMMNEVDHSKEFHPEGNVWEHTMEALRCRKAAAGGFDLRLSLALLLHDAGKPLSQSSGSRRFDGHAELGVRQARRFLQRLGFGAQLAADVCYLVRNHMLPAALPRLPLARSGEIMESGLFPILMELYRCDESSSFKGLDNFYQSSAAYRAYLKRRRNPYRSAAARFSR
jgi:poly(A) polymerase